MKIICVGDPHFRADNIPEVNLFIQKMEELVNQQKPDIIVIMGDVLHTHERLHVEPLNKSYEFIDKMRIIAPTYILVGNHDMCFAKNTPILLWNGQVKQSQEICMGDILVGDDNRPRKVLNTKKGKSNMFKIIQKNGLEYTVTENHILCLKPGFHKSIFWNNTKNRWVVKYLVDLKLKSVFFQLKEEAEKFLSSIPDIDTINISVKDYFQVPKNVRDRLYGYKVPNGILVNTYRTSINIIKSEETDFYGWETDGNHKFLLSDFTVVHNCNNQQFLTTNHWMNSMKKWENVTIVDTAIVKKINNFEFIFCPYVPNGRFIEAMDTLETDWKKCNCIFAHQEFYGCKMGAILSVDGDKWPVDYPNIVSGHIHSKQTPQKNIYYCGSSLQIAFGETETNTIPILTFSKKCLNYKLDEIDLKMPRKKTVYLDVEKIEDYKQAETEDTVKITVSGNYDDFKALKKTKKYKDLISSGTKVVFKAKKSTIIEDNKIKQTNDLENVEFSDILHSLITNEKNKYLLQAYELIVNNKEISVHDILFV